MDLLHLLTISFVLSIIKPISSGLVMGLIAIIVLLACSALISGSEMAYFTLDSKQLEDSKNKKKYNLDKISKLINQPQRLLATILIVMNLVNISVVIISTYVTIHLFDMESNYLLSLFVEFVVVTSLILLFGEMLPKIYANKYPLQVASVMAGPMLFMMKMFHPLSIIMVSSTRLIEKRIARKKHDLSFADLSKAIEITTNEKTHVHEKKLLKRIVKFGDIEVSDVMKPRIDIIAVDLNTGFAELIEIIKEAGFSRLPVYKESFDHIEGILHIKDLLQYLQTSASFTWQELIRPPIFVPENKKINDLLSEFKEKKIHMAVVVDEYGGTSGIVTLEDILEEIVGEINDEYDEDSDNVAYQKIDDLNYVFEGKTSLNDLIKIINVGDTFFDEIKGESESLAGMILEITGKIPHKKEVITYKNLTYTIESADHRRIIKIKLKINPQANEQTE
jgi:gliding motility-associated protein GldE